MIQAILDNNVTTERDEFGAEYETIRIISNRDARRLLAELTQVVEHCSNSGAQNNKESSWFSTLPAFLRAVGDDNTWYFDQIPIIALSDIRMR
jgi:hypothetical protein